MIHFHGRLRRLPKKLLRFPCEAACVQLAGLKPPRLCQESERVPYRPEWSMKAMLEMIDLLHGKLRAVVTVREHVIHFTPSLRTTHTTLINFNHIQRLVTISAHVIYS